MKMELKLEKRIETSRGTHEKSRATRITFILTVILSCIFSAAFVWLEIPENHTGEICKYRHLVKGPYIMVNDICAYDFHSFIMTVFAFIYALLPLFLYFLIMPCPFNNHIWSICPGDQILCSGITLFPRFIEPVKSLLGFSLHKIRR